MLGVIFLVLVFAALIAAVYGREAAQGFVRGMVMIGLLIAIGIGFLLYKLDQVGSPGAPLVPLSTSAGSTIAGKHFGINSEIANPTTCANYGITYNGYSLYVSGVERGSCAAQAGLPVGSIIVAVDDVSPDSQELFAVKARHNVGDRVPFRVVTNDGRWWNVWIQVGP